MSHVLLSRLHPIILCIFLAVGSEYEACKSCMPGMHGTEQNRRADTKTAFALRMSASLSDVIWASRFGALGHLASLGNFGLG